MNNFLRTIIAGYGAKKLGGGCLSTILVFIIIYWALGNCGSTKSNTNAPVRSSIINDVKQAPAAASQFENSNIFTLPHNSIAC